MLSLSKYILVLIFVIPSLLFAQDAKSDSLKSEALFSPQAFKDLIVAIEFDRTKGDDLIRLAGEHIKQKNFYVAIEISKIITKYYPDYIDAYLIAARVYAWQGEYQKSREVLDTIWQHHQSYEPAVIVKLDLEFWDHQLDTALSVANRYLELWPDHAGILFRKSRILIELGYGQQAVKVLERFLELEPDNEEAVKMIKEFKKQYFWHIFSPTYIYNYNGGPSFGDFPYRNNLILEYIRNRTLNPYSIRFNYSNRYAPTVDQYVFHSMMFDADYYKHFTKETEYLFASAGIGFGKNYPFARLGLEYFGMMSATWEYSLGFREIISLNEGASTNPIVSTFGNTFIGTGSVAKYLGNYWLQLKGYYIPRSTLNQQIVDLTIRRYFEDRFNFAFVRAGWGQVQDMQYLWYYRQYVPQDGYKIAVGINKNIVQRLLLKFEYQREIWFPNEHAIYINQTIMAGLWWRFNTGIRK